MTTNQVELVKQSFEKLKPVAQAAGELFYSNLFNMVPQARHMFRAPIAEQAGKLMYTLGYVVTHLHSPETILDDVRKLAVKHVHYGAQPEHYNLVGAALLQTLEQGLASEWNDELKSAWAAAFSMISNAMIEAAYSPGKQAA